MSLQADYYKVLNLKRNCQDDDIKNAFRKLSLKNHPERNNAPGSKQTFLQICEAYSVLSNAERKAIYDQFGTKGLKNGVPSRDHFTGFLEGYEFHGDGDKVFNEFFGTTNPFTDFFVGQEESLLENHFGKKFGGMYGLNFKNSILQPTQDPPVHFDIECTLEELFIGTIKKVKISRNIFNGDGMTTSPVDKILTIQIFPGWKVGTKIIFQKEGDQAPNKIPADLIFTIKEKKNARFERLNDDLIYNVEIPLFKALVGYSLEIQTLDDRILRIPINETISPGFTKSVPGEGMPNSQTKKRGNLIIKFTTKFPQTLSNTQKKLLKDAFEN
ncbi:DnaJ domain-containing protein [Globomyces pollinis-pini]|nr:DnaJ domain-containing protein [Globomyces pollinis-pini]